MCNIKLFLFHMDFSLVVRFRNSCTSSSVSRGDRTASISFTLAMRLSRYNRIFERSTSWRPWKIILESETETLKTNLTLIFLADLNLSLRLHLDSTKLHGSIESTVKRMAGGHFDRIDCRLFADRGPRPSPYLEDRHTLDPKPRQRQKIPWGKW